MIHIGENAKVTGTHDVDQGLTIITVIQFEAFAE
jgi:hypothetical protein